MVEDFEFGCPLSDERVSFLSTADVGLGSPFDEACERAVARSGVDTYVSDVMHRALGWVTALNNEYGGAVSHAGSQMVFGWALAESQRECAPQADLVILMSPIETFRGLP